MSIGKASVIDETMQGHTPAPKALRKTPTPKDETDAEIPHVSRVFTKLSEYTGRHYGRDQGHRNMVARLLRKGYTVHDLLLVAWDRWNDWGGDEEMNRFVRPATLYAPARFADYLAQALQAYEREHGEKARRRDVLPQAVQVPLQLSLVTKR